MDEYGGLARLYDPLVGPFLRPVHASMLDALPSKPGATLDLCCGTGQFAGAARRRRVPVTGIDLSPAMLTVARTRHPRIPFIRANAACLPLAANHFDNATISFALHEKSRRTALDIMKEAVRVVRPGGCVVVADYRTPAHPRSRITGWGIRAVERMAGREHHAHFRAYMEAGGTEALLAEAGLEAHRTATRMGGWCGVFAHTVAEDS